MQATRFAPSSKRAERTLLPLTRIPGALTTVLQAIDGDVIEIGPIVGGEGLPALVEFEWVGWREPLEGGRITRGANQTGIDAVLVAGTAAGRRGYLIEWK